MTNLCLTLAEPTRAALERQLHRFLGHVPMIEVRLDYLDQPFFEPARHPATQLIATCRPEREGGRFTGREVDRVRILEAAAEAGFDWVDLEHDLELPVKLSPGTGVIRSFHSFARFPRDLEARLARLQERGGDLMKLAVFVENLEQLRHLLIWMQALPASLRRVIIGMGATGQLTRLLGCFLGNAWSYVVDAAADAVAPGQFPLQLARDAYRLDSWRRLPQLYGLLGSASLESPWARVQNAWFQESGRECLALPLQRAPLADWQQLAERCRLPFQGFSVEAAADSSFVLPDDGWKGGHVRRHQGAWHGEDTFSAGFLRPLKQRFTSLEGLSALVWGQGELASLAAAALRTAQVRVATGSAGCRPAALEGPDSGGAKGLNLLVLASEEASEREALAAALRGQRWDGCVLYRAVVSASAQWGGSAPEFAGVEIISGAERLVETAAIDYERWTGAAPERAIAETVLGRSE